MTWRNEVGAYALGLTFPLLFLSACAILTFHSNTLYIYEPSNHIRYVIWALTIASSCTVFIQKPWTSPIARRRFLTRFSIFLLPIAFGLVRTHMIARLDIIGTYNLGIENQGIRIVKVREENSCQGGDFCPYLDQFIYIDRGWQAYPVTSLNDFKGLVTISTPEQALAFVRLRSVPTVWPSIEDMEERVFTFKPDSDVTEVSSLKSKVGRFQTMVKPTGRDFVVTRWVIIRNDKEPEGVLELWQEYVGRDGSYQQVALKSEPLPDLPDLQCTPWWQGMGGNIMLQVEPIALFGDRLVWI